jgi:hypothetical protein
MNDLWKLLRIAHDRTEIPAGEFLSELAELEHEITQQTLSNYVARGWVDRRRVDTAPGGRGQTGYYERRMLIPALLATRRPRKAAAELESYRGEANSNTAEYVVRSLAGLILGPGLSEVRLVLRSNPHDVGGVFRARGILVSTYLEIIGSLDEPSGLGARDRVVRDLSRNDAERAARSRLVSLFGSILTDGVFETATENIASAWKRVGIRAVELHEALLDVLRLRPIDPKTHPRSRRSRSTTNIGVAEAEVSPSN